MVNNQKEYDLALDLKGRDATLLFERLYDLEKLLRLHPNWRIETLQKKRRCIKALVNDHATEKNIEIGFKLVLNEPNRLMLEFTEGPLHYISLYALDGRLFAAVSSDLTEKEYDLRYGLGLWLRSIKEYLRLFITATPNTLFFRFIMDHAILKMNPSQRKISQMILRFTALEILVIILIVVGYVIFVL
jgi:hypothetical protein